MLARLKGSMYILESAYDVQQRSVGASDGNERPEQQDADDGGDLDTA